MRNFYLKPRYILIPAILQLSVCCAARHTPQEEVVFDSEFSVYYPGLRFLTALQNLPSAADADINRSSDISLPPDSLYEHTLRQTGLGAYMPVNEVLRKHSEFYLSEHPEQSALLVAYAREYLPRVQRLVANAGLPAWYAYLPAVQSSFFPSAIGAAGGAGPWQLHYVPALAAGLRADAEVDERFDFDKSSVAAIHLLAHYRRQFGEDHLAVLAHVCGAPLLTAALQQAGGSNNYSDLYPFLPKKYREILPAIAAAALLINHHAALGIVPAELGRPASDTLLIRENVHFGQIEEITGVSSDLLAELNPALRQRITGESGAQLRIPAEAKLTIAEALPGIAQLRREQFFPKKTLFMPQIPVREKPVAASAGAVKWYTVKPGDNLSAISGKYGCKPETIMRLNNLKSTRIDVGQKLKIPGKTVAGIGASGVLPASAPADTGASDGAKAKGGEGGPALKNNPVHDSTELKAGPVLKVPALH